MITLKHRKASKYPDVSGIKDQNVRDSLLGLFKILFATFKNIFDDLSNIKVDRGGELPTASDDYLGKFFLKVNSGADDTLHICLYDGDLSTYKWQEVTVS